jgi:hypothetical protein
LIFYTYEHVRKYRSTKSKPIYINGIDIEAKSDSKFLPEIPQALGYMGKCPFNFPTTIY